ncbi:hypothetical protein HZ326_27735 [Fusarium oxysporum f. sp. albedinis]|nr:hypothetical protein HZ326_27735 [Fusarium oxysporum f. sp. albedinis]
MEVAKVESDRGGGGLTIGGIIDAVIASIPKRSQTSTSIDVEDVDPVQNSDKDATSRGTSLPSTHTVRSIAPLVCSIPPWIGSYSSPMTKFSSRSISSKF